MEVHELGIEDGKDVDWDHILGLLRESIATTDELSGRFEGNDIDQVVSRKLVFVNQEDKRVVDDDDDNDGDDDDDDENEEESSEKSCNNNREEHENEEEGRPQQVKDDAWKTYTGGEKDKSFLPRRPEPVRSLKVASPRKRRQELVKEQRDVTSLGTIHDSISSRVGSGYSSARLVAVTTDSLRKKAFRWRKTKGKPYFPRKLKNAPDALRPAFSTMYRKDVVYPGRQVFAVPNSSDQENSIQFLHDYDIGPAGCGHDGKGDLPCQKTNEEWVKQGQLAYLVAYSMANVVSMEIPCLVHGYDTESKMYQVEVNVRQQDRMQRITKECPRTVLRFHQEPVACFWNRVETAHRLRHIQAVCWRYQAFLNQYPRPHQGYTSSNMEMVERILEKSFCFPVTDFHSNMNRDGPQQSLKPATEKVGPEVPTDEAKKTMELSKLAAFDEIRNLLNFEKPHGANDEARQLSTGKGLVHTIFLDLINDDKQGNGSSRFQREETTSTIPFSDRTKLLHGLVKRTHGELMNLMEDHYHQAACAYGLSLARKGPRVLQNSRRQIQRKWESIPKWGRPKMLDYYDVPVEDWNLRPYYNNHVWKENQWRERFELTGIEERLISFKDALDFIKRSHYSSSERLGATLHAVHDISMHLGKFLSEGVGPSTKLYIHVSGLSLPIKPELFANKQMLHAQTVTHLLSSRWLHSVVMMFLGGLQGMPAMNDQLFDFYTKDPLGEESSTFRLIKRTSLVLREQLLDYTKKSAEMWIDMFEASSGMNTSYAFENIERRVLIVTPSLRRVMDCKHQGLFAIELNFGQNGAVFEPTMETLQGMVFNTVAKLAGLLNEIKDPSPDLTPVLSALLRQQQGQQQFDQPLLPLSIQSMLTVKQTRDAKTGAYQYFRTISGEVGPGDHVSDFLWVIKCRLDTILQEAIKAVNVLIDEVSNLEASILSGINSDATKIGKLDLDIYLQWFTKPFVRRNRVRNSQPDLAVVSTLFNNFNLNDNLGNDGDGDDSSGSGDSFGAMSESSSSEDDDIFNSDTDDEEESQELDDDESNDSFGDMDGSPVPPSIMEEEFHFKPEHSNHENKTDKIRRYLIDAKRDRFPSSVVELEDKYRISSIKEAEQSMLERCFEEVHRLKQLEIRIEHEVGSEACISLFNVKCIKAKQELTAVCESLINLLQDEIYDQACFYLKEAMDEYKRLEKQVLRPIKTTEDLSALWNLEVALEEHLLKDIEEAYLKPAWKRFEILDKLQFIRPANKVQQECETYAAPVRLMATCRECVNHAEVKATGFLFQLSGEKDAMKQLIELLATRCQLFKSYYDLENSNAYAVQAEQLAEDLSNASDELAVLKSRVEVFDRPEKRKKGDPVRQSESTREVAAMCNRLTQMEDYFDLFHKLWTLAADSKEALEAWNRGPFMEIDPEQIEQQVQHKDGWLDVLQFLLRSFDEEDDAVAIQVSLEIQNQLLDFRQSIPLIRLLRSEALKPRHWYRIIDIMNPMDGKSLAELLGLIGHNSDDPQSNDGENSNLDGATVNYKALTLGKLLELRIGRYLDDIAAICAVADREYEIETNLNEMADVLKGHRIKVSQYNASSNAYVISTHHGSAHFSLPAKRESEQTQDGEEEDVDDDHETLYGRTNTGLDDLREMLVSLDTETIDDILEEQLVRVRKIQASEYTKSGNMMQRANEWGEHVMILRNWLKAVSYFQKQWIGVEALFGTHADDRPAIRLDQKEVKSFHFADVLWKKFTNGLLDHRLNLDSVASLLRGHIGPNLPTDAKMLPNKVVDDLNECMEELTKVLCSRLEGHRQKFARLYFLPDDQLLALLTANHVDYDRLQEFIPLLFDDVGYVQFRSETLEPHSREYTHLHRKYHSLVMVTDHAVPSSSSSKGTDRISIEKISAASVHSRDGTCLLKIHDENAVIYGHRITNMDNPIAPHTRPMPVEEWLANLEKAMQIELAEETKKILSMEEVNLVQLVHTEENQQALMLALRLLYTRTIDQGFNVLSKTLPPQTLEGTVDCEGPYGRSVLRNVERNVEQARLEDNTATFDTLPGFSVRATSELKALKQALFTVPKGKMARLLPKLESVILTLRDYENIASRQDRFLWDCHFRYYFDQDGEINVETVGHFSMPYQFNVVGSHQRLVLTPLTVQCLRTLFLAAGKGYVGANIGGPTIGKTAIIEELAYILGTRCVKMPVQWFDLENRLDVFHAFMKGIGGCQAFGLVENLDKAPNFGIISNEFTRLMERARRGEWYGCLFATLSSMRQSFKDNSLPLSIARLLRPCYLAGPDTNQIATVMLMAKFGMDSEREAKTVAHTLVASLRAADRMINRQVCSGLGTILMIIRAAGQSFLSAAQAESKKNIHASSKIDTSGTVVRVFVSSALMKILPGRIANEMQSDVALQVIGSCLDDASITNLTASQRASAFNPLEIPHGKRGTKNGADGGVGPQRLRRKRTNQVLAGESSTPKVSNRGATLRSMKTRDSSVISGKRITSNLLQFGSSFKSNKTNAKLKVPTTEEAEDFVKILLNHAITRLGYRAMDSSLIPSSVSIFRALGLIMEKHSLDGSLHQNSNGVGDTRSSIGGRGVILVGPSFSGKSTMLRTVIGALKILCSFISANKKRIASRTHCKQESDQTEETATSEGAVQQLAPEGAKTNRTASIIPPPTQRLDWWFDNPIQSIRVFPDAMSLGNILGGCDSKGELMNGILLDILSSSTARGSNATVKRKTWMEMDEEFADQFNGQDLYLGGVKYEEYVDTIGSSLADCRFVVLDGQIETHSPWLNGGVEVLLEETYKQVCCGRGKGDLVAVMENMKFVFETTSLENASPSIISKCKIVYTGKDSVTYSELVYSWLHGKTNSEKSGTTHVLPSKFHFAKKHLESRCDTFLPALLELHPGHQRPWKLTAFFAMMNQLLQKNVSILIRDGRLNSSSVLDVMTQVDLATEEEEMKKFEQQRLIHIDCLFMFAVTWAVGQRNNEKFENEFRKIMTEKVAVGRPIPTERSIFEYVYDIDGGGWWTWEDKRKWLYPFPEVTLNKLSVYATPQFRAAYFIRLYLHTSLQSVFCTGPKGSGKSTIIRAALNEMKRESETELKRATTLQTISLYNKDISHEQFLDVLLASFEKQSTTVYGPPSLPSDLGNMKPDTEAIIFFDDLSAKSNSAESIRQILETNAFYRNHDKKGYMKHKLVSTSMIAASTSSHGIDRNSSWQRLLNRFYHVIEFDALTADDMQSICSVLMRTKFFDDAMYEGCLALVRSLTRVWGDFATQEKSWPHVSAILDIYRGLVRVHHSILHIPNALLEVWAHQCIHAVVNKLESPESTGYMFLSALQDSVTESSFMHLDVDVDNVFDRTKAFLDATLTMGIDDIDKETNDDDEDEEPGTSMAKKNERNSSIRGEEDQQGDIKEEEEDEDEHGDGDSESAMMKGKHSLLFISNESDKHATFTWWSRTSALGMLINLKTTFLLENVAKLSRFLSLRSLNCDHDEDVVSGDDLILYDDTNLGLCELLVEECAKVQNYVLKTTHPFANIEEWLAFLREITYNAALDSFAGRKHLVFIDQATIDLSAGVTARRMLSDIISIKETGTSLGLFHFSLNNEFDRSSKQIGSNCGDEQEKPMETTILEQMFDLERKENSERDMFHDFNTPSNGLLAAGGNKDGLDPSSSSPPSEEHKLKLRTANYAQLQAQDKFFELVRRRIRFIISGKDLSEKCSKHSIQQFVVHQPSERALSDLALDILHVWRDHSASFYLSLFPKEDMGVVTRGTYSEDMLEMIHILYEVHLVAQNCAMHCESGKAVEVSDNHFLRLVWTCAHTLTQFRSTMESKIQSLERATIISDVTSLLTIGLQKEVQKMEPQLMELKGRVRDAGVELRRAERQVASDRKRLEMESNNWAYKEEQASTLRQEMKDSVDRITPVLAAATDGVQKLARARTMEIKNIKTPPVPTRLIAQCVYMVLFNEPCSRREILLDAQRSKLESEKDIHGEVELRKRIEELESDFSEKNYYWKRCQSPHVFGDPKLTARLVALKKDGIDMKVIEEIEEILTQSHGVRETFGYVMKSHNEEMAMSSTTAEESANSEDAPSLSLKKKQDSIDCQPALEVLLRWLLAIMDYRKVVVNLKPKQEILSQLSSEMGLIEMVRKELLNTLQGNVEILNAAQTKYDGLKAEEDAMTRHIEKSKLKAARCEKLSRLLNDSILDIWRQDLEMVRLLEELDVADGAHTANAMIVSGCLVYFGFLDASTQATCISEWMELLLEKGLRPSLSNATHLVDWSNPSGKNEDEGKDTEEGTKGDDDDDDDDGDSDDDDESTIGDPVPLSVPGILGNIRIDLDDKLHLHFPLGEILGEQFGAEISSAWFESGLPLERRLISHAFLVGQLLEGNSASLDLLHRTNRKFVPRWSLQVPVLIDPHGFGLRWLKCYISIKDGGMNRRKIYEIDGHSAPKTIEEARSKAQKEGGLLIVTRMNRDIAPPLARLILSYGTSRENSNYVLCVFTRDMGDIPPVINPVISRFDFSMPLMNKDTSSIAIKALETLLVDCPNGLYKRWATFVTINLSNLMQKEFLQAQLLAALCSPDQRKTTTDDNNDENLEEENEEGPNVQNGIQSTDLLLGDDAMMERVLQAGEDYGRIILTREGWSFPNLKELVGTCRSVWPLACFVGRLFHRLTIFLKENAFVDPPEFPVVIEAFKKACRLVDIWESPAPLLRSPSLRGLQKRRRNRNSKGKGGALGLMEPNRPVDSLHVKWNSMFQIMALYVYEVVDRFKYRLDGCEVDRMKALCLFELEYAQRVSIAKLESKAFEHHVCISMFVGEEDMDDVKDNSEVDGTRNRRSSVKMKKRRTTRLTASGNPTLSKQRSSRRTSVGRLGGLKRLSARVDLTQKTSKRLTTQISRISRKTFRALPQNLDVVDGKQVCDYGTHRRMNLMEWKRLTNFMLVRDDMEAFRNKSGGAANHERIEAEIRSYYKDISSLSGIKEEYLPSHEILRTVQDPLHVLRQHTRKLSLEHAGQDSEVKFPAIFQLMLLCSLGRSLFVAALYDYTKNMDRELEQYLTCLKSQQASSSRRLLILANMNQDRELDDVLVHISNIDPQKPVLVMHPEIRDVSDLVQQLCDTLANSRKRFAGKTNGPFLVPAHSMALYNDSQFEEFMDKVVMENKYLIVADFNGTKHGLLWARMENYLRDLYRSGNTDKSESNDDCDDDEASTSDEDDEDDDDDGSSGQKEFNHWFRIIVLCGNSNDSLRLSSTVWLTETPQLVYNLGARHQRVIRNWDHHSDCLGSNMLIWKQLALSVSFFHTTMVQQRNLFGQNVVDENVQLEHALYGLRLLQDVFGPCRKQTINALDENGGKLSVTYEDYGREKHRFSLVADLGDLYEFVHHPDVTEIAIHLPKDKQTLSLETIEHLLIDCVYGSLTWAPELANWLRFMLHHILKTSEILVPKAEITANRVNLSSVPWAKTYSLFVSDADVETKSYNMQGSSDSQSQTQRRDWFQVAGYGRHQDGMFVLSESKSVKKTFARCWGVEMRDETYEQMESDSTYLESLLKMIPPLSIADSLTAHKSPLIAFALNREIAYMNRIIGTLQKFDDAKKTERMKMAYRLFRVPSKIRGIYRIGMRRRDTLEQYKDSLRSTPSLEQVLLVHPIWLPAFSSPGSIIWAIVAEIAKRKQQRLANLDLWTGFALTDDAPLFTISGLALVGASWNNETNAIDRFITPGPLMPIPPIHVYDHEVKGTTVFDPFNLNTSLGDDDEEIVICNIVTAEQPCEFTLRLPLTLQAIQLAKDDSNITKTVWLTLFDK